MMEEVGRGSTRLKLETSCALQRAHRRRASSTKGKASLRDGDVLCLYL